MRFPKLMCAIVLALTGAAVSSAAPPPVKIEAALGNPVMLSGAGGTNYLRVAVTGDRINDASRRVPLNVAIVIDRSGSMQGEKIEAAKRAAKSAIERLRPNDTVSVIAYETSVTIVQPAIRIDDNSDKAATTRQQILSAIDTITAGGSTALFAGVSMGAGEVRKEIRSGRINRIVLLSDGLANVGPSSPGELAELGTSLGREGICVTTLGLGLDYNEDLLSRLASTSDGNHMFIDSVEALDRAYAMEFGDAMTVVARGLKVRVECVNGVRPVRVLGRDAIIDDKTVLVTLGDVSSERTKYALVELDVPAGLPDGGGVANVSVWYPFDTESKASGYVMVLPGMSPTPLCSYSLGVRMSQSKDEVDRNTNKAVMVAAVQQIAAEKNELAMRLRDSGKIEEARQTFLSNQSFLFDNSTRYNDEQLRKDADTNGFAADNLDPEKWKYNRKLQQEYQVGTKKQGVILEKSVR
ncbi:MAG: VWA domain-containing protein [Candidatus Hydrogenedentes bacterium]|nr:VWA domain-containing protein [Candidatus Hydrogenedentota bacterium]